MKAELAREMEAASAALDFESAARYRDRLAALSHVQSHQGINPQGIDEADVFAVHQDGGLTCIQVFFFRTGQNWGNRAYFPKADKSLDAAAVLEPFLAQFYDDKPVPRLILVSTDFEERELLPTALCEKAGHKVEILVPQRGEKRELVEHALANAREALARKLADTSSAGEAARRPRGGVRACRSAAAHRGLRQQPRHGHERGRRDDRRRAGGLFEEPLSQVQHPRRRPDARRRFRDDARGDAPALRAAAQGSRTARRDASEAGEALGPWPDLVLIDGGKGQLSAAASVLAELGIADVPIVSVAKGRDREAGRETFFMAGREPFMLPHRDPVLYFIERLRDEAHRFAIGSHRARRKKEMQFNPLDEIAGVGPTRKRALLRHFGTAKAVSRAGGRGSDDGRGGFAGAGGGDLRPFPRASPLVGRGNRRKSCFRLKLGVVASGIGACRAGD